MGTNEGQVSTFVDTWVSALMSLIEDFRLRDLDHACDCRHVNEQLLAARGVHFSEESWLNNRRVFVAKGNPQKTIH